MATGSLECRKNGHAYHWSWYCLDRVCDVCLKHETRGDCPCGWPGSVEGREDSRAGADKGTLLAEG